MWTLSRHSSGALICGAFHREQPFRKLYSRRMQFSRTALLSEATDVRWVTLNCQTRAKAHIQGERPCYVNLLLHLLPQLPSARWRWLPPQLPLAGVEGAVAGVVGIIITTGAMASASATTVAMAMTDAM